ncbi:UDP-N-acetylmuramoyl-L-alanyl-D-glutamate--2,6-diaminopimelate ligase [Rhodohalobacter sp. 8-1]|uniref:UDP-N-acetylmuramoyl-L-alanyl-D-glutamate--2, 6-diaminopimelate ligase n=1 Tax=Rhodohalobacter sp. 8-1 TaxID=3131972 RepID=UPI0030EDF62F
MTFSELITFCNPVSVIGQGPNEIGMLCQDSRKITPGDTFIAIRGISSDGHKYIKKAVKNGATVIICEEKTTDLENVVQIIVKNTRSLIGPLAQKMAGNPGDELTIIGITGTNGKTTVATLIWQVLTDLGQPASLLGTVEKRFNRTQSADSALTTADPIEIAGDMKKMVQMGSKFLVMEVSSHALAQQRTNGIPFYVAVFTNLSHDHLDYHKTEKHYAKSKKKLFDSLDATGWAITNVDDPYGEWITKDTAAKVIGLSFEKHNTVQADIVKSDASGTQIDIEDLQLKTSLIGKFNAYNAVQAVLALTALGFDGSHIAESFQRCTGAPGRMERVNESPEPVGEPIVVVDYAHTPDALENVSQTLASLKQEGQKLTILFGCGGDRDKSKRPKMAAIAEKYGDRVIVTSDNPRSEDPEAIIKDILAGFKDLSAIHHNSSRKEAIEQAILEAGDNDIVLIAGKGHETYQEINGERSHFDDREEAREALKKRASSKTAGGD